MQMLEAFRALNALNEDTFSLDADGINKLSNFTQNDDLEDDVQIIDPEAETEEDLQDNYIGKVILDCCVCHSKLYKDPSEVDVDETGELANVGEECPYCFTPDGFKVIGEVVEFGVSKEEEEEPEVEGEEPSEEEDPEEDTEEVTESLNEAGIMQYSSGNLGVQPSRPAKDELCTVWTFGPGGKKIKFIGFTAEANRFAGKLYMIDDYEEGDEKKAEKISDAARKELIEKGILKESFNESFNLTEADDLSGFLNAHLDKIIAIIKKIWPKNLTSSQITEINNNIRALQGTAEGNKLDKLYRGVNQKEPEVEAKQPIKDQGIRNEGLEENIYNGNAEGGFLDTAKRPGGSTNGSGSNHQALNGKKTKTVQAKDLKPGMITDTGKILKVTNVGWINGKPSIEVSYGVGIGNRGSNASDTVSADREYQVLDEPLNEAIEDLSMTANDTHIEVSEEENGKVTVSMEPATNESGKEMIASVSPETEAEIMSDEVIEDPIEEPVEELPTEETSESDEIDAEFDEFDEEKMNGLGESYFKKVYENVESFRTTAVKTSGNSMIIEGLLKFDSGNEKSTSFIFEALDATRNGRFRFVGDNKELTEGKKAFMLTGTINNKKLMVESMNYNYKHTDTEGNTSRVYGTERIK